MDEFDDKKYLALKEDMQNHLEHLEKFFSNKGGEGSDAFWNTLYDWVN